MSEYIFTSATCWAPFKKPCTEYLVTNLVTPVTTAHKRDTFHKKMLSTKHVKVKSDPSEPPCI